MLFKSREKDIEYDYLRPSRDDGLKELKEKLRGTEEELGKVEKSVRLYSKRMVIFGFAAWIVGLASFFSSILISGGGEVVLSVSPFVKSVLVGAIAVPFGLTAILARRLRRRMEWSLRERRREILSSYHQKVLTFLEERSSLGRSLK